MPTANQIKDQSTPYYLTFQAVCCIGLFLKTRQGQQLLPIKQQYTEGNNTTTKVWAGACEYITENGQQKTLTYLSGPEGVFALHVKNPNGTENIRYIHKDHLGSWNTITDENGNLLQELSFDAWGNRRNPATWRSFTGTPPAPLFDRGFTGHEHLFGFSLVNMNGRMYDPLVSRMLSPDNFIQAPDFSQSFNRYSYVWNNPLVLTDMDGEWVHLAVGAFIGGTMNWMMNGGEFTWDGLKHFGAGALAGALSAGVGVGIQTAFSGASFWAGFVGSSQGISTILSVGYTSSFAKGALAGAGAGFSSGFITSTGNVLIQGQSFDQALGSGLEAGGWGALSGGLIGGTIDGIKAHRQGNNFFLGRRSPIKPQTYRYKTYFSSDEINSGCFFMTMDKLDPSRSAYDYQELWVDYMHEHNIAPRSPNNFDIGDFLTWEDRGGERIGLWNSLLNNPPSSGYSVFTYAPGGVGFGERGHAMPVTRFKIWPNVGNEVPPFRVYINNHGTPFILNNANTNQKGLSFWLFRLK